MAGIDNSRARSLLKAGAPRRDDNYDGDGFDPAKLSRVFDNTSGFVAGVGATGTTASGTEARPPQYEEERERTAWQKSVTEGNKYVQGLIDNAPRRAVNMSADEYGALSEGGKADVDYNTLLNMAIQRDKAIGDGTHPTTELLKQVIGQNDPLASEDKFLGLGSAVRDSEIRNAANPQTMMHGDGRQGAVDDRTWRSARLIQQADEKAKAAGTAGDTRTDRLSQLLSDTLTGQKNSADQLGIGAAVNSVTNANPNAAILDAALADLSSTSDWTLADVASSLQQFQIAPEEAWQYWGEKLAVDPAANAKIAKALSIDLGGY